MTAATELLFAQQGGGGSLNPNMLDSLSWQPWNSFATTNMSKVGSRIRCAGATNTDRWPGAYKTGFSLTAGKQYRVRGSVYSPFGLTYQFCTVAIGPDVTVNAGGRQYSKDLTYPIAEVAPALRQDIDEIFIAVRTEVSFFVFGNGDNTFGDSTKYWEIDDNFYLGLA